jgi:hypothetical protein
MRLNRRFFYSRYFLTGVIAVAVIGITAIFRVVNGGTTEPISVTPITPSASARAGRGAVSPEPIKRVARPAPSASAGAQVPGDDGLAETTPSATVAPSVSATTVDLSGATARASQFARAWLAHTGLTADAWRANLAPDVTTAFRTDTLPTMTPDGITATTITGPVVTALKADSFVGSDVPMDTGTLKLTLVADSGQWFVSTVDWASA